MSASPYGKSGWLGHSEALECGGLLPLSARELARGVLTIRVLSGQQAGLSKMAGAVAATQKNRYRRHPRELIGDRTQNLTPEMMALDLRRVHAAQLLPSVRRQ
jgi:hypothetical protein